MTTDPKKLAEWRALSDAATPGEWRMLGYGPAYREIQSASGKVAVAHTDEDAALIAASREALPALLDEVERLRGLLARVEPELAPGYDGAERLRVRFGLERQSSLVEDIRAALSGDGGGA